jgi:hypothetical protein
MNNPLRGRQSRPPLSPGDEVVYTSRNLHGVPVPLDPEREGWTGKHGVVVGPAYESDNPAIYLVRLDDVAGEVGAFLFELTKIG